MYKVGDWISICSFKHDSKVHRIWDRAMVLDITDDYVENNAEYFSPGVDADVSLDVCCITKAARELALKYQTVILATGQTDIITDGERVVYVKNGVHQLTSVTGTGCMLGALCSAFMTFASPMNATISSCCYLGICGELAKTESGNGSFMVNLMDKISTLGREEILKYLNMEER